jgi:transcriptional regulator with XRE-family HTH domain
MNLQTNRNEVTPTQGPGQSCKALKGGGTPGLPCRVMQELPDPLPTAEANKATHGRLVLCTESRHNSCNLPRDVDLRHGNFPLGALDDLPCLIRSRHAVLESPALRRPRFNLEQGSGFLVTDTRDKFMKEHKDGSVHVPCTIASGVAHDTCTNGNGSGRTILEMLPTEIRQEIGRRIRLLREAVGAKRNPRAITSDERGRAYSQSDLSADSNGRFSKSQIANYEQGTRIPALWDAAELARLLNSSAAYILCLDEGQPTLTQSEIDLVMNFRDLPIQKRADFALRVCELAEAYKSRHTADVRLADSSNPLHNTEHDQSKSAVQKNAHEDRSNPPRGTVTLRGIDSTPWTRRSRSHHR